MYEWNRTCATGATSLSAGSSNNRVNAWLTNSYFVKVGYDVRPTALTSSFYKGDRKDPLSNLTANGGSDNVRVLLKIT